MRNNHGFTATNKMTQQQGTGGCKSTVFPRCFVLKWIRVITS